MKILGLVPAMCPRVLSDIASDVGVKVRVTSGDVSMLHVLKVPTRVLVSSLLCAL